VTGGAPIPAICGTNTAARSNWRFDQFTVTIGVPILAICGTNTAAHSKWRFDQLTVTLGAPIPAFAAPTLALTVSGGLIRLL
jgi:hypothetical protein